MKETMVKPDLTGYVNEAAEAAVALAQREGEMEAALNAVRERHAAGVAAAKARADAAEAALKRTCTRDRAAIFGGKQSVTVSGHKLAWRLSPAKVVCADGLDEDAVIERLEANPLAPAAFLVREPSLNRQAILRDWDDNVDILKRAGLVRSQKENFRFTPAKAATTAGSAEGKEAQS